MRVVASPIVHQSFGRLSACFRRSAGPSRRLQVAANWRAGCFPQPCCRNRARSQCPQRLRIPPMANWRGGLTVVPIANPDDVGPEAAGAGRRAGRRGWAGSDFVRCYQPGLRPRPSQLARTSPFPGSMG